MDEEREIVLNSHNEYLSQADRVERVISERKNDFVEELMLDFEQFLTFVISQLSEEEIYNGRGLRIKYSIIEGKLRREGRAFLQTMSVVMDPVFGYDRVFGNYEDFFSAFREFKKQLKDLSLMFKVDPIPARFSAEETSTIEVFVYFDIEK